MAYLVLMYAAPGGSPVLTEAVGYYDVNLVLFIPTILVGVYAFTMTISSSTNMKLSSLVCLLSLFD